MFQYKRKELKFLKGKKEKGTKWASMATNRQKLLRLFTVQNIMNVTSAKKHMILKIKKELGLM